MASAWVMIHASHDAPVSTVITFLITVQYHWHQRRFVLEIDRAWRAHERSRK